MSMQGASCRHIRGVPGCANLSATADGLLWAGARGESVPVPTRDDGRGYLCADVVVATESPFVRVTAKVHRLVWAAFNGRMPRPSEHIDHINHIKTDNRPENLRLRDPRENSADCRKTSRKGMRVLTDEQREMVVMLCLSYQSTKAIAELCGIGETTVRRIRRQMREAAKDREHDR